MEIGLSVSPIKPWRTAANDPFNNHATLGDDLVSYWPLSADGTDSVVASGNNLTNNNSVTFVAKGAGAPANMPDNVANFVAASSQYFGRTTFQWPTSSFTMSAWYNLPFDAVNGGEILGLGDVWASSMSFRLIINSHATIIYPYIVVGHIGGSVSGGNWDIGGAGFTENAWHHVVVWFDGTNIAISVDQLGDDTGPGVIANTYYTSANTKFSIGSAALGSNYRTMMISSPAVWSRVLTAGERADLYNAGDGLFY
jgi:hypothetical protein